MTSTRADAGPDPLLDRLLDGRYQIRARLGAGGMGVVYRALQLSVGREVAIKVVQPAMLGDRVATRRFLREVSLAARLTSPHSVQVIDFGETPEGTLYLVMELLTGEGLDAELRRQRRLSPARAVDLAIQVCDALAAAHASSFVHRDLKPSNVFLARDAAGRERVKVLDFGIARGFGEASLTGSGEVVGSPPYVAPEAIRGDALDGRVDLYALGCLLHQLVTGAPPFLGESIADTFRLHLAAPPPPLPPSAPPALHHIVARLLAKQPAERFASAGEVRDALVAVQPGLAGDAAAAAPTDGAPAAPPTTGAPDGAPATTTTVPSRPTGPVPAVAPLRDPTAPPTRRRGTRPLVAGSVAFALALIVAAAVWRAWPRAATPTVGAPDATLWAPVATPPDTRPVDATPLDAGTVDAPVAAPPVDAGRRAPPPPPHRDAHRTTPAPPVDAAPPRPPPSRRPDAGVGFVLPT